MAKQELDSRGHESAFAFEHSMAWVMALVALALGGLGLLVGFGVIGGSEQGVNIDDAAGAGGAASDWMQGALWLLPAIAAALLSRALHSAEHHSTWRANTEDSTFSLEHGAAYVVALLTIATAALAPLVGFDVFDNGNVVHDGFIWGIASLVPAVLTGTLHAVGHHQTALVRETEVRTTPATTIAQRPR